MRLRALQAVFILVLTAGMSPAGIAQTQAAPGAAPESQGQTAVRSTTAVDLARKNVLILHSFAYAQPAYAIIDAKLAAAFVAAGLDFNNLHFEFMDLARNPGPEHRIHLIEIYRQQFKVRKIDLIIALHTEALQFLLNESKDLFSSAPIISVLGPPKLEHADLQRPVIVLPFSIDIIATVKAITALQSDVQKVVVVSGSSGLDRRFEGRVKAELQDWQGSPEVEYVSDLPLAGLLERTSSLPPKTAILYTTVYADRTGKTFMPPDVMRLISASANAPLFGLFETLLGDNGVVGGIVLDHRVEGERAVRLAMEILQGKLPSQPLTVLPAPLVPMFDWLQIKRWGLDASALPEGSMLLNRPVTSWSEHKGLVIGAVSLFLVQALLIGALLVQRQRRRRAEESLRQKKEELDQFFRMTLDLLCIANTDGYYLRLNPAWEKTLGFSLAELMSKRFLEFVHPDDVAATQVALQALASQKQVVDFANRYRSKDGTYRHMLWSAAAVGNLVYAAARDITERLQAEAAIHEREKELQTLTGRLILGQEEERRRLARELHDDLSQRLAVLAIEAGKTETALKDGQDAVLKPLRGLRDRAIQIAADVHNLSRRLHPSILDDLGLSKAVESECARFSTQEGVDLVCSAQNIPERLPRDISLSIYRIVQECLNNIAKHACARHVSVSLSESAAGLQLSVKDDGIGFDAAEVRRRPGLGLSSIRERVRLVHGRHRITSEPEKGTTIEVTVPLN